MTKIKHKKTFYIIMFFSFFALTAAYFIQYVLGHQPCNLCLIERIPYILVIIIITFCLFLKKSEKISLIIISLIFFLATLVSFYHFGIEQGFFKESLVCDLGNNNSTISAQDLLKQLEVKTVSCKDVTFKILGFSLATINTIISLLLSGIMCAILKHYEKNK